jgi:ring-1,2-phenylacetyl-CoA epoxidase subunit PaaD
MDAAELPGVGLVTSTTLDVASVLTALDAVVDPEIPVLTIADLGVLRSVSIDNEKVTVTITPTYSGCPAMRQIEDDIAATLRRIGIDDFDIQTTYKPAWNTDWISNEGRAKLNAFGIAPPVTESDVLCPRCSAPTPRLVARFGSTACKALMVCSNCSEPFDYFKELK